MLWHTGRTGGFRAFTAFLPQRGSGVLLLVNDVRSPDRLGLRLLDEASR